MKSTIIAIVATLALATPALAWDDNDTIREQGREAQQDLQRQMDANAAAMQQRQQAQFNWGAQCAARNYQNCY